MESRKRSRTEDSEPVNAKKRLLSDSRESPIPVNGAGHDTDEPKDDDNLELFRKDAIYRRMKHYSRENDRNIARIAELEKRRSSCEAGLAALEACWTQLLATIQSLVKAEEIPQVDIKTRDVYDLTTHISQDSNALYVEELRNKMQATEQLVVAFVGLSRQGGSRLTQDDMYKQGQEAQSECASLRSEVSLLHVKLRDAEFEKEQYHAQLVAAEKRIDRLQSKTVAAMNSRKKTVKEELKDESPRDTPSSPTPNRPVNGDHTSDAEEWEAIAANRQERIDQLLAENKDLSEEVLTLKMTVKYPSETVVQESLWYKALLKHASKLEYTVSESQTEIKKLKQQIDQLQAQRWDSEKKAAGDQEKTIQELRNTVVKRDNDLIRLRDQRDQLHGELNERKQKEAAKTHAFNECRALLESRSERLRVYESEVTRLKSRMAAEANNEDLMNFFFRSSGEDVSYVEDLKKRLSAAEERLKALADIPPSERDLKERLASAIKELNRYKSVFGDSSPSFSSDAKALAQQLRRKEEELERLRMLEKQHEQAEASLYTELEKLSAAWEALDRQVKSKVFDLAAAEDRVAKSGLEKAKAENKFYAAMRDKEASDAERKNVTRTFEKQSQALEKLLEIEKTLGSRVKDLEREASLWKHAAEQQEEYARKIEKDIVEWQDRARGERNRTTEALAAIRKYETEVRQKKEELRLLEESMLKSKKEAEKQAAKTKTTPQDRSYSSSREAELQSEVDKCMDILKCSTCKMNMRNTVITKCMHSFCRNCVNERISSRQRKCPACNVPFSQGEVQQLYFQ